MDMTSIGLSLIRIRLARKQRQDGREINGNAYKSKKSIDISCVSDIIGDERADRYRDIVRRCRADDDDWVTVKGTHVLLGEGGVAQSGGKLKGMTFSKSKSTKSGGKGRNAVEPEYEEVKIGRKTYKMPIVDNKTGTNPESAKKINALGDKLDDKRDDFKLNEKIRDVIKEKSPTMIFPQYAKTFGDGVQCASANEKKDHINNLLDEAIKEYDLRIAYLKSDPGYDYEIEQETKNRDYYIGLKNMLK